MTEIDQTIFNLNALLFQTVIIKSTDRFHIIFITVDLEFSYILAHTSNFLQADKCAYYTQYIKKLELLGLTLKSYFYMVEYCGNF